MFALTLEKIMGFFGFPDVCNTPTPAGPTPIPYPNIGQSQNADSGTCAEKVYFCDMQAFIMKTKVTQTMGDEAGTNGGIVSGKNMDELGFVKGSMVVFIEGSPAINVTSMTKQNGTNSNTAGNTVQSAQKKVMIMQ